MTSRGDNRIMRSSYHPVVTIGLTLSTLSPTITPSSTLTLSITAHILKTPHPNLPVTLAAYQNPFAPIPTNPSYTVMRCIVPEESGGKRIEINRWAPPWTVFTKRTDLREGMDFPSLASSQTVTIHHTVPAEIVEKAQTAPGVIYKAVLTNRCLGAVWWGYGDKPEGPIGLWMSEEEEGNQGKDERRDEKEGLERLGKFSLVEMDRGDDPQFLALVIESGEVDFEVV